MMDSMAGQADTLELPRGKSLRRSTPLENLQDEQTRLEKRLTEVKRGIEILNANPQIEELIHILGGRV